MSDHRLKGDLAVMYKAFLIWKKAQQKFWVVHWQWRLTSYLSENHYFWSVDVLPCLGKITRNGNSITVQSMMGGKDVFLKSQCKIFYVEKDARKFCKAKRQELFSRKELF